MENQPPILIFHHIYYPIETYTKNARSVKPLKENKNNHIGRRKASFDYYINKSCNYRL